MRKFIHIILVVFLTLITQVGGLIWIMVFGYFKSKRKETTIIKRLFTFILVYLLLSLLLIPQLAKFNNRVALPVFTSGNLVAHNIITNLLNRHYVKPQLRTDLLEIAELIHAEEPNLKLSYLDANFPFIDGFPLLPHLSHDDGRKVDLSFYYTRNNIKGNFKPTRSGYGQFVDAKPSQVDQAALCIAQGQWQYDYSKYFTLGSRSDLSFDQNSTKALILYLLKSSKAQKIFIEPHLRQRMNLSNAKIRFQGCHSVRHDDHIHYQIK